MVATVATPCAAKPNCAGIRPGDWAWFREDGIALHAIGGCKDASGRAIRHIQGEEGAKGPPPESR